MVSRARKGGLTLSLHDILQSTSITNMAQAADAGVKKSKHQEKTDTLFNLSPIQQLYFQYATQYKGASRFNQSVTIQLSRSVESSIVEDALKAIVGRHAMLRARFSKSSAGHWLQKISAVSINPMHPGSYSLGGKPQLTLFNRESTLVIDSASTPERARAKSSTRSPKPRDVLILIMGQLSLRTSSKAITTAKFSSWLPTISASTWSPGELSFTILKSLSSLVQ